MLKILWLNINGGFITELFRPCQIYGVLWVNPKKQQPSTEKKNSPKFFVAAFMSYLNVFFLSHFLNLVIIWDYA